VVSEIYPYPPSGRSFEIPWEWKNSEAKIFLREYGT